MTQDNCNTPGPIKDYNFDSPPGVCREDQANCENDPLDASLLDVPGRVDALFEEFTYKKTGVGERADCDPMLTGHIVNGQDGKDPNPNVIYRYSKSLRGTDEAVKSLFNDVVVQDDSSKIHPVPIIWGTQEKAVMAVLGQNYRKDNSMVVDRVKLPLMAIHSNSYDLDMKRYAYHKAVDYLRDYKNDWRPGFAIKEKWDRDTVIGISRGIPINIGYNLIVWTMYSEDMMQIVEQILRKIAPMGYIRVRGIGEEIPVIYESMTNNIDYEPGDQNLRVVKFQFSFRAESYIAQPYNRKKAVLRTRTEIVDSIDDDNIAEVLERLEQAVEELQ